VGNLRQKLAVSAEKSVGLLEMRKGPGLKGLNGPIGSFPSPIRPGEIAKVTPHAMGHPDWQLQRLEQGHHIAAK
jgi:hypothetical protein